MKKRGRPRLKVTASDAVKADLKDRVKTETNAGLRDRMRAVLLAFDGTRRFEDIAAVLGRSRSQVQVWMDAFEQASLAGLLTSKKAPGKASAMQKPEVQNQIRLRIRRAEG